MTVGALFRPRAADFPYGSPHSDALWVRAALVGVAALAAVLYTWGLSANGYGNSYYAAAALAASKSWSAWFFGSLDAGNFITLDKPPLSTMVSGLSVRLFGLSSWSILLPQALMGVATVALLFHTVRRSFGPVAAVVASLVMAFTPVAVLMFRLNDTDALLTLLVVVAAALLLRAVEDGRIRWAILAGAVVGLAFLTKYLQAYLVLPAFAAVWTLEARTTLRRRIVGLIASAAAVLVSSAWWVIAVELVPASQRPYIGGSTNNSVLDLLLGYDGLQRIFGFPGRGGGAASPGVTSAGGPVGAPGGFGGPPPGGGAPGALRLFNGEFVGQIAWLIPLALYALAVGLVLHARTGRGDPARAGYLLWGIWLLGVGGVFSFMSGIVHSYYAVMLAPAIAVLIGGGIVDLWHLRSRSVLGEVGLSVAFIASAWIGSRILALTPSFAPGLGTAALIAATVASMPLLVPATRRLGRLPAIAAGLGLAAALAGPTAYALETALSAKTGAVPSAGPAQPVADRGRAFAGGPPPSQLPAGRRGPPGSAFTPPSDLTSFLVTQKGAATWIVATRGAQEAGSLELATGEPVMAIGGFSGSDPAPTLDELKRYVASGRLRYVFVAPGPVGGPGGPGDTATATVDRWVRQNGTVVNVGASYGTLYDLAGH